MAADTIVYRDVVLLIAGGSFAGQFTELNVKFGAEMLPREAFGSTTREKRGGLTVASMDGKGFSASGAGLVEDVLYALVGATEVPIVVFPTGVTEGSQSARGYAMMGVVEHLTALGQHGTLLQLDFAANGAGLGY